MWRHGRPLAVAFGWGVGRALELGGALLEGAAVALVAGAAVALVAGATVALAEGAAVARVALAAVPLASGAAALASGSTGALFGEHAASSALHASDAPPAATSAERVSHRSSLDIALPLRGPWRAARRSVSCCRARWKSRSGRCARARSRPSA
jgi:hypothetical protein